MTAATALSLALTAGCTSQPNFTGVWKANCANHWGVQITPVDEGRYAVTFCGLSGCLPRGEWMPDTRIVGDPMYEVVSARELRIKHDARGHLTYDKCSDDPFWRAPPR